MKTTIRKINSRVWEWLITAKGKTIAGGYCRTKRDALNDSTIQIKAIKA